MAEAPAVRTCGELVKDRTGKTDPCGMTLPKGQPECKNKENHVRKLKSGFCGIGACEGKKTLSKSGKPLKPCGDWQHCPCKCHVEFDELYSMMQRPRQYHDMSGYEQPHNPYKMPSLEERAAMHAQKSSGLDDRESVVIESPMPEVIPSTLVKTFNATATGRAARGELESWVRAFCDEYLVEKYPEPCTPKFVAEKVGKAQGINPPSQGAVDAVFARWANIGFAVIEKKPTRFVGYTPDGIKLGLEAMKLRERDKAKRAASTTARVLRPKG